MPTDPLPQQPYRRNTMGRRQDLENMAKVIRDRIYLKERSDNTYAVSGKMAKDFMSLRDINKKIREVED